MMYDFLVIFDPSPPNVTFLTSNVLFWESFYTLPLKIGHHLCTFPKYAGQKMSSLIRQKLNVYCS